MGVYYGLQVTFRETSICALSHAFTMKHFKMVSIKMVSDISKISSGIYF